MNKKTGFTPDQRKALAQVKQMTIEASNAIMQKAIKLTRSGAIECDQAKGIVWDAKVLLKASMLDFADSMAMTRTMEKEVSNLKHF